MDEEMKQIDLERILVDQLKKDQIIYEPSKYQVDLEKLAAIEDPFLGGQISQIALWLTYPKIVDDKKYESRADYKNTQKDKWQREYGLEITDRLSDMLSTNRYAGLYDLPTMAQEIANYSSEAVEDNPALSDFVSYATQAPWFINMETPDNFAEMSIEDQDAFIDLMSNSALRYDLTPTNVKEEIALEMESKILPLLSSYGVSVQKVD